MITRAFILSAVLFSSVLHAAEPLIEDLLRQGLFEEEANRDFDKAEERYRAVVSANDKQRALAATATYRLGEIARKKNNKEAAIQAFRTVLERFPEQADLARLSRENLNTLGAGVHAATEGNAGTTPAEAMRPEDEQDAEIRRLGDLAKNSPDLLDGTNPGGWRPMHTAAKNGWVKVISYLLENKADPDSRTTKEQLAPLQIAAIYGHLGAVGRLLEAGAKIDAETWLASIPQELLPARDQDADKASGNWTALDFSVLYDRREIAKTLAKAGADVKRSGPELQRVSGELTSLQVALCLGRRELADELLAAGASANMKEGCLTSPLSAAVDGCPEMVPALLKAGANPDTGERVQGVPPLATAVRNGRVETAKILIEGGANVNAADDEGLRPLHRAMSTGLVDLLVSEGADPNAVSKEGYTPLDMVVMAGSDSRLVSTVEALLKQGAKVRNPDDLVKLAKGPMLDAVRERAIYPLLGRPDNVLLSFSTGEKDSNFVVPAETRPGPGSPPPSALEAMWLLVRGGGSQVVYQIRILRAKAGGTYDKVFDWGAAGSDGKRPQLPALEWGDILEINMGWKNREAGDEFALQAFLADPAEKTVTYRLNGVPFTRRLEDYDAHWLGSLKPVRAVTDTRSVRIGQPGMPQPQPQPQARVVDRSVATSSTSAGIAATFRGLENIPWFVDASKVSVRRKGMESVLSPDVASGRAWPFRLVDGDIVDFVISDKVSKELKENPRALILADDLNQGGLAYAGSLSSILILVETGTFDWTSVRILGGGTEGNSRKKNMKAWLDPLPDFLPGQVPWDEIAKNEEKVAGGDWVILPRAKEQLVSQEFFQKMRMIANPPPPPVSERGPRTRVTPPPVPAE